MSLKEIQILLFFIFISGCSCGQPDTGTIADYFGTERTRAELDNFIESTADSLKIPGVSFALINEGAVVHHKTLGYADRESGTPVTGQTIFEAASLSKSVFAFFVMTYVEQGQRPTAYAAFRLYNWKLFNRGELRNKLCFLKTS